MDFQILDINDKVEWNTYLSLIPRNDIYFSPEYLELGQWNKEGIPLCAVMRHKEQIIIYPFLLNTIKGKYKDIQSGYGYGGMISNSSSRKFISSFFDLFKEWCENEYVIAEFIRFHPIINNQLICKDYANVVLNRRTVFLDLNSKFESIWMRYDSKCRNVIRKSLKNEFIVENNELSISNLRKFHALYHKTMINVGAKEYYFFTLDYLIKMAELLKNKMKLYTVHYKEELVAGALFLYSSTIVNYHLSARDARFGKNGIVNLMLNQAIKDSNKEGYQLFHFGGGNSLDEKDSLYKFKKSFSKQTADFYIGTKIHNKNQFEKFNKDWEINNEHIQYQYANVFLKYRM